MHAEQELAVRERRAAARCAWCHDALGPGAVTCDACRTRLHRACASDSERCPTLGCLAASDALTRARQRVDRVVPVFGLPERAARPRAWSRWGLPLYVLLGLAILELGGLAWFVPQTASASPAVDRFRCCFSPDVQRWAYPLVAWALAAYLAAGQGRRAPWILAGLRGGWILGAVYAVLFLPLLPVTFFWLVLGVGVLGLTPYVAWVAFSEQLWAYPRGRGAGLWSLGWGLCAAALGAQALDVAWRMQAALP